MSYRPNNARFCLHECKNLQNKFAVKSWIRLSDAPSFKTMIVPADTTECFFTILKVRMQPALSPHPSSIKRKIRNMSTYNINRNRQHVYYSRIPGKENPLPGRGDPDQEPPQPQPDRQPKRKKKE